MRHAGPIAALVLSVLVVVCTGEPTGPEILAPGDTAQTRGTLLTRGDADVSGNLVWVPGTELVAFVSFRQTGETAIKTVDVATRSVGVVDGDCAGLARLGEPYFRGLAAATDGGALYYTVGVGSARDPTWVLRVTDLAGDRTTTLRSGVAPALAVSPDGRRIAYVAGDSLFLRDLPSGAESHYADYDRRNGTGGPIVFSPGGTELLYGQWVPGAWPLRRLSLTDGTAETMALPAGVFHAQLFHWGPSGIEALVEVAQEYPSDYRVVNLTTGASVQVGQLQQGDGAPWEQWSSGFEAWSADGTRVAYWIARCLRWAELFDCETARYALFVADAHTGTRVRVAYTSEPGPTVFSPDGRRIVYQGPGGEFYLIEVPPV